MITFDSAEDMTLKHQCYFLQPQDFLKSSANFNHFLALLKACTCTAHSMRYPLPLASLRLRLFSRDLFKLQLNLLVSLVSDLLRRRRAGRASQTQRKHVGALRSKQNRPSWYMVGWREVAVETFSFTMEAGNVIEEKPLVIPPIHQSIASTDPKDYLTVTQRFMMK